MYISFYHIYFSFYQLYLFFYQIAQSAGAVEYTDCTSAEG